MYHWGYWEDVARDRQAQLLRDGAQPPVGVRHARRRGLARRRWLRLPEVAVRVWQPRRTPA